MSQPLSATLSRDDSKQSSRDRSPQTSFSSPLQPGRSVVGLQWRRPPTEANKPSSRSISSRHGRELAPTHEELTDETLKPLPPHEVEIVTDPMVSAFTILDDKGHKLGTAGDSEVEELYEYLTPEPKPLGFPGFEALRCTKQTRYVDACCVLIVVCFLILGVLLFQSEQTSVEDNFQTSLEASCDEVKSISEDITRMVSVAEYTLSAGLGVYTTLEGSSELRYREFVDLVKQYQDDAVPIDNLREVIPVATMFQRVLHQDRQYFEELLGRENDLPYINFTNQQPDLTYQVAPDAEEYMVVRYADRHGLYGFNTYNPDFRVCPGNAHRQVIEAGIPITHARPFHLEEFRMHWFTFFPLFDNYTHLGVPNVARGLTALTLSVEGVLNAAINASNVKFEDLELLNNIDHMPPGCPFTPNLFRTSDFTSSSYSHSATVMVTVGNSVYPMHCYGSNVPSVGWGAWVVVIGCALLGLALALVIKLVKHRSEAIQSLLDSHVKQLRESQKQQMVMRVDLESIISAIGDPMMAFDVNGVVVSMNRAAAELSGFGIHSVEKLSVTSLFRISKKEAVSSNNSTDGSESGNERGSGSGSGSGCGGHRSESVESLRAGLTDVLITTESNNKMNLNTPSQPLTLQDEQDRQERLVSYASHDDSNTEDENSFLQDVEEERTYSQSHSSNNLPIVSIPSLPSTSLHADTVLYMNSIQNSMNSLNSLPGAVEMMRPSLSNNTSATARDTPGSKHESGGGDGDRGYDQRDPLIGVERFAENLGSSDYEVTLRNSSGDSIAVEATVGQSAVHRGAFVVIFRDIRYRKQYERQLVKAKRTADTANKNKGDFVAFICHELRNPLHAIIGLTDILQQSQLTNNQSDVIKSIYHSSKLMNTIVNDVLDLSKVQINAMEMEVVPFDLPGLLRAIDENSRMVVGAKVGSIYFILFYFILFYFIFLVMLLLLL